MAAGNPPKRRNPANAAMARAGNYVAMVDTAGMDPAMKETLGMNKPKAKKMSMFDGLLSMFGMGPKVQKN